MSGPFNYVRNIKYSFPADMAPPSSATILRDLWQEVRAWRLCAPPPFFPINLCGCVGRCFFLFQLPSLPLSLQPRPPQPPPSHTNPTTQQTQTNQPNTQVLSKERMAQKLSLLQERLRIGWGTARVAVGMAFTSHVYEYCKYGSEGRAGRELRRRLTGRAPEPPVGGGDDDEEEEEEGVLLLHTYVCILICTTGRDRAGMRTSTPSQRYPTSPPHHTTTPCHHTARSPVPPPPYAQTSHPLRHWSHPPHAAGLLVDQKVDQRFDQRALGQ